MIYPFEVGGASPPRPRGMAEIVRFDQGRV